MITAGQTPTAPDHRFLTLTLSCRCRRQYGRLAVEGVVAFHTGGGESLTTGRLIDLSSSGLRLRSRVRLETATPVIGVIQPDGSATVEFLGEVVRVVDGSEPELAVRFLYLTERDRQQLERILIKRRRAQPAIAGMGRGIRRAASTLRLGEVAAAVADPPGAQ